MAKEVRTERRGSNPFTVIVIFLAGAALIGCVLFLVKLVNPGLLPQLFGSPDPKLVQQNQELASQLNASETTNGELRAALAAERQNHWIPVVIIIGIIAVVVLLLWVWLRNRRHPELTLDEAIGFEKPRARDREGFPADYFPTVKVTARSFERLKSQAGVDTNEYMYFIEYQFLRAGRHNQFWHGLQASPSSVITVALTSKTYQYREQWYPGLKIRQAIKEAHEHELWGFSLQKTKLEEDFTNAIENARSFQELQREYTTGEAES